MGSIVLGTTQNAYLELSDAISNVFHRSQRYSRKATTLGSVKMAIDGLSDPVVNLFLFFVLILFLLCSFFQKFYLDCLQSDPVALGQADYVQLLGKAKRSFETFRKELDPSFIYPPVFKTLQTLIIQCDRAGKTSNVPPALSGSTTDTSGSGVPSIADKGKSLPTKVSIHFMCTVSTILLTLFLFFHLQVKPSPPLSSGVGNDHDSEEEREIEIIMHAPFNNIAKDLLLQTSVGFLSFSSIVLSNSFVSLVANGG